VKDEDVADRVALAWRMKIRDNASYLQIHEATHLYSDSKHYSDFFDNLLYAGIFHYHSKRYPANWEEGAHFCEPYVTLEEYLQVQANRQRRTPTLVHPRSLCSSYLLTGMVVCGVCSENGNLTAMVGQTDNRRQDTHYYRCSTKIRSRGHDCIVPRVPCWRLDQAVMTLLRETVLTPEYISSVVTQANELLKDSDTDDTDVEGLLDKATRQARAAQRKVEAVIELMGKKGITSILEAQYDAANRAWLEATAQVHSLKAQPARAQSRRLSLDDAKQCLDEMLATLSSGLLPERRALIARFVERVEVHPTHADVKLKFRLDALTAAYDGSWLMAISQKEADSLFRSPRQVYGWCPQGDRPARVGAS
jgi:hypothetical protein